MDELFKNRINSSFDEVDYTKVLLKKLAEDNIAYVDLIYILFKMKTNKKESKHTKSAENLWTKLRKYKFKDKNNNRINSKSKIIRIKVQIKLKIEIIFIRNHSNSNIIKEYIKITKEGNTFYANSAIVLLFLIPKIKILW